ncbi:MAG TPA: c-type cytochrome domain-containing protein [Opitutus sp.]|nr:c-type cytochrome domain-containing protein [Opitutus sp.]
MTAAFACRLAIALIAIGLTFAAAWLFPFDGVAHGGAPRLLGRLHPLLVHFPLGLLLLVPLLEIAGRWRPALREAAGFVLGLAMIGAVAAVFAGVALARGDGHEGALVTNHLWGGIAVAVGTAIAWLLREYSRFGYMLILLATVGTLGWAAHQGGSLTHGAFYLTEALPGHIKQLLRIAEAPVAESYEPGTVFSAAVLPMLEKHCIACHGAEKQKGDYRMDSFAALKAGGKSGKLAIIEGEVADSELVRRLLLDPTDDKAMPPPKKPRPTAAEIALLRWWIKQGAPRDLALTDVRDAPKDVTALLATGSVDAAGVPVYVRKVGDYSQLQAEIAQIEDELGIDLVPVSRRAGDGLILRTRAVAASFGDAELARMTTVAPFVVEAELAGTKVTDAGLAALRPFTQLERLHLERTAIRGETLSELSTLGKLRYLNLCDTQVNDEALSAISKLPALQELYLFGSQVTARGVTQLRATLPECEVGPVEVPRESDPGSPASADPVEARN